MPRRKKAWAAWTHQGLSDRAGEGGGTYWMNELQSLPGPPLFVSLNPVREPDPALVLGEWDYEHPVFDTAAVRAKIMSFSHQEYNQPERLASIDVVRLLRSGGDLYGRAGYQWAVVPALEAPLWLRSQPDLRQHFV